MTTPQSSDPNTLLGQWTLTGFYEEDAGHRDGSYVHIFQNTSAYAADKFNDASGETLSVTETDGEVTFQMRGGAQVPWTSAEKEQGVLNAIIEDLDGRVVASIQQFSGWSVSSTTAGRASTQTVTWIWTTSPSATTGPWY